MKEALTKLFVAANDSECERVKELLARKGFEYSLVGVRKSELTPLLSRDIGAERVPASYNERRSRLTRWPNEIRSSSL